MTEARRFTGLSVSRILAVSRNTTVYSYLRSGLRLSCFEGGTWSLFSPEVTVCLWHLQLYSMHIITVTF